MNLGHILFSFSGRINRAKWWLSVLIIVIIDIIVLVVNQALSEGVAGLIGFILGILVLWIALAAGAKRLHDLDRSGAWLVLFIGAPILLIIVLIAFIVVAVGAAIVSGGASPDLSPEVIADLISKVGGTGIIILVLLFALWLWMLIWLGCLRGTVGPNRFGPDPLEGRI